MAAAPGVPDLGQETGAATDAYVDYQEALGIWKMTISAIQSKMQAEMDAAAGSKEATKAFRIAG